jgi:UDP-N-acetylmuramate--alanine ligase
MAGLAEVLLDAGATITGSEPTANDRTAALLARGVEVADVQDGRLLDGALDLVVRTAAVPADHAEMAAAERLGLATTKYAALLGEVMAERFGVAVAGTHGKSTTSSMLAHALLTCGADPSFVIGATAPQLGGGSRSGGGRAFVAEACEYDRSFHHLRPDVAVITNIEADHLDCYGTLENVVAAFGQFAKQVRPGGVVIACANDANCRAALAEVDALIEWVGPGGEWDWRDVTADAGRCRADVVRRGEVVARLELALPGEHTLFNATAALAAAVACGVDIHQAAAALGTFQGVDRRMTHLGRVNGADVVDDYGHHPTEIRVTLDALRRRYEPRRLVCVFQPHQHSRTRHLLGEFARCFADADEVVLPDVYSVRDAAEDKFVGSGELCREIKATGKPARHIAAFEDVADTLRAEVVAGDLVVTMGAGPVDTVGKLLVVQ